jgi:hypothetical protein
MLENNYNFFVIAAIIASKLDQATKISRRLSLTACNARAVSLKAGEGASGFRPLTDFINRLANVTISSSLAINKLAANLSKTAADKFRADNALYRFTEVYDKAGTSPYIKSLDVSYNRTKKRQIILLDCYKRQLSELTMELDTLEGELRTAVILATLSRVEASQAGETYREALNNVADNVEDAASLIKLNIRESQQLVYNLREEQ